MPVYNPGTRLVAIDIHYYEKGDVVTAVKQPEGIDLPPDVMLKSARFWMQLPNTEELAEINVSACEKDTFNFFLFRLNALKRLLKKIEDNGEITEITEENFKYVHPDMSDALFDIFSEKYKIR